MFKNKQKGTNSSVYKLYIGFQFYKLQFYQLANMWHHILISQKAEYKKVIWDSKAKYGCRFQVVFG